jgi:CheY-like chemotaxis protein
MVLAGQTVYIRLCQKKNNPKRIIGSKNADVRTCIKTILQADYTILEAGNGKNRLIKAMQYVPDLIVSDVMMDGRKCFLFTSLDIQPDYS